jgi:hypothetical protein
MNGNLIGNEIKIQHPKPANYRYSGGISREEYKIQTENLRSGFIALLKEQRERFSDD